jgi:hypothetical protein
MLVFVTGPLLLGLDTIFEPGTYWTTTAWNIGTLAWGGVAAAVGGLACRAIARRTTAVKAMAAFILILGVVSAMMNLQKPNPPARTRAFSDMPLEEATKLLTEHAKEPDWYAFAKTIVGAGGVLLGGRRRSNGPGAPPTV